MEPDFTAPVDDLVRMSRDVGIRSEGDGTTLYGYLAMFDEPTVIDSWEGRFEESIRPGAFRKTVRESRDNIVPLFNHGFDPSIGDKPLGRFSVLEEDLTAKHGQRGLYYEVPLSDTSYNADIAALVRDRAIPGNSFRFSVVKEEWEKPKGKGMPKRSLVELKLREGGPVTFPAYQATTLGIRSREAFGLWRGLDDTKRSEISRILGIRTSDDGAGIDHSDDASRDDTPDEPAVTATPEGFRARIRAQALTRGITK